MLLWAASYGNLPALSAILHHRDIDMDIVTRVCYGFLLALLFTQNGKTVYDVAIDDSVSALLFLYEATRGLGNERVRQERYNSSCYK